MRRWLRAGALAGVASLALAGCGVPAGTDGDLADDWPALAQPVVFQPADGTCHLDVTEVGHLTSYHPLDCGKPHRAETVHVGTLTGEHAERGTPPPVGSPARRAAFAECEKAANRALGADWRSGRTKVFTVFPSTPGWQGGARWFRCDVAEVSSVEDPIVKDRIGSLKGALTGDSPIALRCFDAKLVGDDIDEMAPVSCTSRHDAEFVGVYRDTSASHAAMAADNDRIHRRCLSLVASYARIPDDGDLRYRSGTIYFHPDEQEWRDGNRAVRCFLWISDGTLTRSAKGGGTKTLPIRYA